MSDGKYNIIEYKAPDDYLSINDFYKIYGYTCFYQSDTREIMEIDPEELTITYVCNHYPRKMIKHLEKVRGIESEKQEPGIYYLKGDAFKIQLLITRELSKEENYWLQSLRNDLRTGEEIQKLVKRYEAKKYEAYYSEVMDLIVRANWEKMKEEKEMCEALRELFADELKESQERGIEQGENRGIQLTKKVYKLAEKGASVAVIAEKCGIAEKRVQEILE